MMSKEKHKEKKNSFHWVNYALNYINEDPRARRSLRDYIPGDTAVHDGVAFYQTHWDNSLIYFEMHGGELRVVENVVHETYRGGYNYAEIPLSNISRLIEYLILVSRLNNVVKTSVLGVSNIHLRCANGCGRFTVKHKKGETYINDGGYMSHDIGVVIDALARVTGQEIPDMDYDAGMATIKYIHNLEDFKKAAANMAKEYGWDKE